MKKINFLMMLFICLIGYSQANAQCIFTASFGTENTPPTLNCASASVTTCNFAGEFFTVNNLVVGETYSFSSAIATDFLTVTDLANVPFAGVTGTGSVSWTATATSVRVHVALDAACGTQNACRETFVDCSSCPASPVVNDLCADAIDLGTTSGTIAGTTVNSCTNVSTTMGAPGFCGTVLNTAGGVWYTFTPIANGFATFDVCGAPYDSKLAVFEGPCTALTCIAGEDDDFLTPGCGSNDPFLGNEANDMVNVVAGTTYYVYVTGFGANTGTFDLNFVLPSCTLMPPAAQTVSNDAGVCGAQVSVVTTAPGCADPVTNDFNGGGADASGVYPVGTTTVTFTSGGSTATTTVTVTDDEGPTLTCPGNSTINLDPGACEQVVSYSVTGADNCPVFGPPVSLSLNNDLGTFNNSIACPGGGYQTLVVHDYPALGITEDIAITSVDFGIFQIFGTVNLTVNVYSIGSTPTGAFNYADLTLLATGTQAFGPSGAALGNMPMTGTIPAGTVVVLELIAPNGSFTNGFVPGYNNAGVAAGGDTWLASTFCGVPNPTPIGNVVGGFTDQMVFQLNGNLPAEPMQTAGLASGSAFPIGTTTNTYTFTDNAGNTTTCSWSVTVNEFVPSSNAIACNSLVHVSLDENCQAILNADQILEGNNFGCYDNYPVTYADGPNQGLPVTLGPGNVGQTINVMVTNPSGNPCWGQVLVEDKRIPDLVCTDISVGCNESTDPGAAVAATLDYAFSTVTTQDNNTVSETVAVTSGDEVQDLDVAISTTHTWIGDVDVTITSPSGTVVTLFDRPGVPATAFGCNNTVDMNFSFDDAAAQTAADFEGACPPDGAYQSIDALAAFNGEPAQGTWTVDVTDNVGGDGGDFDITLNLKAANSGTVEYPVPAGTTVLPAGANTFTVIGFDPCGPATLTFSDSESGVLCDGNQAITRNWSIVDGYGNTSSCTQTITINPTTLAEITGDLPGDITLECGTALPAPITDLGCENIGLTLDGDPVIIDICGNGFKMLRKYVVVDWCTGETVNHTQIIKVEDTTAPVVTCPADLTVSTTSNSCTGNVALIMPTWTDCGGGVTFSMTASAGTISGNLLVGLPIGTHDVTFTGTDACGNSETCVQKITVEDNVSPTAVCDEHTIVSLGSDGTALVNATTFDDGSNDNCGIVSMEAQRMDNPSCPGFDGTSFGATVPFYCCDIGSTVMVAFRVTDAAGNTNTCMVEVDVQDKMNPTIVCKPDLTISCDDPIIADIQVGQPLPASAVALVGTPAVTDNCNATISSNVISSTLDNCGMGEIKIAWSAVDGAGNFDGCFQSIFINDANPFNGNSIVWPQDYEANTCGLGLEPEDLPTANGFPTWDDGTCSNIASTHEDTQLGFGADNACLTILRKWIIIDWCAVPAGADPTDPNTTGVWHYTQVIKVLNSTAPVIESFNGATTIDNFDENCGGVFVAFDITASDDCTPANLLSYAWEFSTGTSGQGTAASATFVNGTYSVTFTVSDQCGNSSTDSRTFTVADKKKPTPVCIFGIASTVMPSAQQVTIWASDFESGSSYDNCTDYNNLIFSFSPVIPGQPIDDNLVITCADVPSDGLVPVTLYVTDAAGNFDFCTTFINVQDPNGACPGPNTIFGAVQTEDEEMVEDVIVTVEDNNGPMTSIIPVVTGVNGTFSFNTNGMSNATYDVIAEKDVNYLNGVTTYDLVLISKHILGIEILDSPYKIIAADANHSETITGLDVVKLRALILHIDDELSNNDSWRFVDANYTFNNPANPFGENFPEFVEAVPNSAVPSNFTGIKIGDVNATASPNSLLGTEARTMDGQLAIQAKAMTVAQGETFTIDFTAKDFNNIAGYQFTLGFDNSVVEFVDLTSNLEGLNANNFGLTKTGEGVITTSWNSNRGVSVENNEVLFSVTFVANADVNTQDIFTINSRLTASEAYQGDDLLEVVLAFNGTRTANGFELYQNTPNPFKAETMIGFNLPEAGEVTLKIFDVSGRILRLIEMDAAKGYNSVDVNRAGIDATGVLYYQLETATETATKKMIIVD